MSSPTDEQPLFSLSPDTPEYIGRHLHHLRRFAAENPEAAGLLINALVGGMVQSNAHAFMRGLGSEPPRPARLEESARPAEPMWEPRMAEAKPVEGRVAEARLAEARAGEIRAPESRTAEARPLETRPIEARPAEPAIRSDVDRGPLFAAVRAELARFTEEDERTPERPFDRLDSRPEPRAEVRTPHRTSPPRSHETTTGEFAATPPPGAPEPPDFEIGDLVQHRWLGVGVVERVWWREDHWHVATDRFGAPATRLKKTTSLRG